MGNKIKTYKSYNCLLSSSEINKHRPYSMVHQFSPMVPPLQKRKGAVFLTISQEVIKRFNETKINLRLDQSKDPSNVQIHHFCQCRIRIGLKCFSPVGTAISAAEHFGCYVLRQLPALYFSRRAPKLETTRALPPHSLHPLLPTKYRHRLTTRDLVIALFCKFYSSPLFKIIIRRWTRSSKPPRIRRILQRQNQVQSCPTRVIIVSNIKNNRRILKILT